MSLDTLDELDWKKFDWLPSGYNPEPKYEQSPEQRRPEPPCEPYEIPYTKADSAYSSTGPLFFTGVFPLDLLTVTISGMYPRGERGALSITVFGITSIVTRDRENYCAAFLSGAPRISVAPPLVPVLIGDSGTFGPSSFALGVGGRDGTEYQAVVVSIGFSRARGAVGRVDYAVAVTAPLRALAARIGPRIPPIVPRTPRPFP